MKVIDTVGMFDALEAAIVAADPQMNIIYANDKARELFRTQVNHQSLVGRNLADCHKPETVEKIKTLFEAFRHKTKEIAHYVMKTPKGQSTVVQIPFYDKDQLSGVVEFIFKGTLA